MELTASETRNAVHLEPIDINITNVEVEHDDEWLRERLEIARLLDERYRLREDPDRRDDLVRAHEQPSKLFRELKIDGAESEEG